MIVLSVVLSVILVLLAALHAYWALGGLWPGHDEKSLVDTVVGTPRLQAMPSKPLTWIVVAIFLGMAASPHFQQHLPFLRLSVVACMFLGRGVLGYLPYWRHRHSAEPFARNDRRYYSPFCLIIGVGFACLDLFGAGS